MTLQEEDLQQIRQIVQEVIGQSAKPEYANVVELSNANSKGDLHITVKGRSDGPLKDLVEDVKKQYKEAGV
ncbi:MAG: hypothetical protein K5785_00860 [Nitrosarchaeum sp.]|nr:hypothetical protein [Nitrosarchaeum sp.]